LFSKHSFEERAKEKLLVINIILADVSGPFIALFGLDASG
jgi:hypothetical protein